MMEGITVLNEYASADWAVGLVAIIPGAIIFILCLCLMIGQIREHEPEPAFAFGIFCFLSLILITGGIILCSGGSSTHYQVTIDDSVAMNEFNERYEILDVDGRIYTIKEK